MLVNKYLKAGEVDDINQAGRFFKVISSETEFRIRVTNGADVLIDTVAAAGFDVQTSKEFTLIQVISEQQQKVQFWVSEHKLGYDALTNGSNVNQSTLIEHYGGSQKVLPFEKNRSSITLFSDSEPFWYGGEGVTIENGIPVAAGVEKDIKGSGELHIAINKPPKFGLTGTLNYIDTQFSSILIDNPQVVSGGFIENESFRVNYFTNKDGSAVFNHPDLDAKFFASDNDGNLIAVSIGRFSYKGQIIAANAIGADGFGCVSYSNGRLLVGGWVGDFATVWEYDYEEENLIVVKTTNLLSVRYLYSVFCTKENEIFCLAGVNGNGYVYKVGDDFLKVANMPAKIEGLGAVVTEADGFLCFCTRAGRVIIDKAQSSKADILPSFLYDVGITKDKWVGVNSTEIYESLDSGASWQLAGEFERTIGNSNFRSRLINIDNDWYISIVNAPESAGFALVEQMKLTEDPIAKIRMLKEVV